jgi:hypothetical protein
MVKMITSFEDKSPFEGGKVVEEHATEGKKALRIDKCYAIMSKPQDWTGYDFLKADLYADSKDPLELYVEVRDVSTRDYWTRVNYVTVAPPGQSTLIIPVKQLYVGEKSRPGRMLDLKGITWFVLSAGEKPQGPLFVDNVRLERDDSPSQVAFDGLLAFDFGTGTSPVMEGFTPITPATVYSKGRGYGLKDAKVWRAMDVLQPEPLYQDFICIESGSLVVDVPNGKYRVFLNIDNPSGFWGEYQVFRKRAVLAQGKPAVTESMDFEALKKKYFRFWNVEDLPTDNTFDKYQKAYYQEKTFDVDVINGQLKLDFQGENWGCSVAAAIIFPVEKAAQGEKFLKYAEAKRRFYFDNYFKRVLHRPTGDPLAPSEQDKRRGFIAFQRDAMQDVFYNDTPRKDEIGGALRGSAFAGEYEPVTLGLVPLADMGKVTVTVSDLKGPAGTIPADAIDVGYVSYRVSRVTMEGTVYTINPRLVLPCRSRLPGGTLTAAGAPDEQVPLGKRDLQGVEMPKGTTRRFWLTVKTPADAKPGVYKGLVAVSSKAGMAALPIEFRVRAGKLDPADVPAGPWGYSIGVPWVDNDKAAAEFNRRMTENSLKRMREYGFTTCSGIPHVYYRGFKDGKPVLDFKAADEQMKVAKDLGFLAIVSYGGGVSGINAYYQDDAAMKAAGFSDYSAFIKAVYSEVQKHADQQGWVPIYWNLGDEPIGDDLRRSAENAEAYRKAFPKGPPWFTAASSYDGKDPRDPHFRLAKALQVVNWNLHSEDSVRLLHEAGCDWAFYNGGNRWTFGDYMYKAAKQFGMKFRISWHWNCAAGDPYYALDCREDDYAWCNAAPDGSLVPAVEFERTREGLDDYRRLVTLARLAKEKAGTPAAKTAEELISARMASFKLNQREHDQLFPASDWNEFRAKVDDAIEALRK